MIGIEFRLVVVDVLDVVREEGLEVGEIIVVVVKII